MKVKFNPGSTRLQVVKVLKENLYIGLKEAKDCVDDREFECSEEQYPAIKRELTFAGAYDFCVEDYAWSEEDERICQCLIQDQKEAFNEVSNDKYGHSEIISDLKEMYRERIAFLKSLKSRIQT